MKSWLLAKRARWVSALALLAIAALALKTREAAPEVGVSEAAFGSLELPIAASGKVEGLASDLGFGISGRISEVYVDEGQEIHAEQTLARVDPVGGLMDGGPGSDVILAPFDGWVVAIYQRQGASVAQGVPVLRVVKRQRAWVTAFIDAEDAASIHPGDAFTCRAGGYLARPWNLRVTEVGREAVPREDVPGSARQIRVQLRTTDADFALAVGTPVDVDGVVDLLANALLIPAAAVVRDNGQSYVWIEAGGEVTRRAVDTGPNNFRQIAVTAGLSAGERVVVEHKVDLEDGQRVNPVAWSADES